MIIGHIESGGPMTHPNTEEGLQLGQGVLDRVNGERLGQQVVAKLHQSDR